MSFQKHSGINGKAGSIIRCNRCIRNCYAFCELLPIPYIRLWSNTEAYRPGDTKHPQCGTEGLSFHSQYNCTLAFTQKKNCACPVKIFYGIQSTSQSLHFEFAPCTMWMVIILTICIVHSHVLSKFIHLNHFMLMDHATFCSIYILQLLFSTKLTGALLQTNITKISLRTNEVLKY